MTIQDRLRQIKERLDQATPGPWQCDRDLMTFNVWQKESVKYICHMEENDYGQHDDEKFKSRWDNSDFIANSPSDIKLLLSIVEIYREAIEWYNSFNLYKIENGNLSVARGGDNEIGKPPLYERIHWRAEEALEAAEKLVGE